MSLADALAPFVRKRLRAYLDKRSDGGPTRESVRELQRAVSDSVADRLASTDTPFTGFFALHRTIAAECFARVDTLQHQHGESCVDSRTLTAYYLGLLTPLTRNRHAAHIHACTTCQRRIETLILLLPDLQRRASLSWVEDQLEATKLNELSFEPLDEPTAKLTGEWGPCVFELLLEPCRTRKAESVMVSARIDCPAGARGQPREGFIGRILVDDQMIHESRYERGLRWTELGKIETGASTIEIILDGNGRIPIRIDIAERAEET